MTASQNSATHTGSACADPLAASVIVVAAATLQAKAQSIASVLNLPLVLPESDTAADLHLHVQERGLELRPADDSFGPVSIDFCSGRSAHRRYFGGGRKQMLARAAGVGKADIVSVLDATAGLGNDAFVLATLGLDVVLLEQSPVLALMLDQAISTAAREPDTAHIAQRMQAHHAEATAWLQAQSAPVADVIYLDPMYPARRKSAKVKKGMQLLHRLVGPDQCGAALLQLALTRARCRVVVKRPADAPPLLADDVAGIPRIAMRSPNTRYDVYLTAPLYRDG